MSKKVNIENRSFVVWEHSTWEMKTAYDTGFCQTGIVKTKLGIIEVMRHEYDKNLFVRLTIYHNGREYVRVFDKCYSRRYCMTLAKKFIKKIKSK